MTTRLELCDMNVTACASAEEAMQKIKNDDFDSIILDIVLPGMDGIQALKEILSSKPDARVILLTGHATIESCVQAMKLGAVDFIEKPVDLKRLCKKIRTARSKQMQTSPEQAIGSHDHMRR